MAVDPRRDGVVKSVNLQSYDHKQLVFIKDLHVFSHNPDLSPTAMRGCALPLTTAGVCLEVAKVKGMMKCRKVGMIRYSPERPVHLETTEGIC